MNSTDFEDWAKGAVGHAEQDVLQAIVKNGGSASVVKRDGMEIARTADGRPNHANLTVESGVVTAIRWG